MQLFFTVKQIGRRKDFLTLCPYSVDSVPRTLRELITELVRQEVQRSNEVKSESPSVENHETAKVESGCVFSLKRSFSKQRNKPENRIRRPIRLSSSERIGVHRHCDSSV